MRIRLLPLALSLVCSGTLGAEAVADPKTARRADRPPFESLEDSGCGGEGNAADVACLAQYLGWLDSQMNVAYLRALKALPEQDQMDKRKEREQLRKSQRAWLVYERENCALVGGREGGSNLWVTHFAAMCNERELKERIKFLKAFTE
ncbi:lysozyme inhibitor LprI family protein [Caenimonas aquaedulcis]|uniref:DUF1311 domain-containing protein n=1 Tax=Caenimonas aquaedulcis TaxID=2793270 RepID=A0A931H802_9BURK|nr:lysozyme inhibitor LprI family protein [Caenimonas aquaedulcis]MBG9390082.1 DUF1311 domain-containing protein [Caenimonas aquaedulcis]